MRLFYPLLAMPTQSQPSRPPPPDPQLERLIGDALEAAGLRVGGRAQGQLALWLGALLEQPRNLTAVREPAEAVAKHVIEPLLGFEAVLDADIAAPHGAMIDVGSGNGAPGVPVGVAYPDRPLTLLDSRGAAVEFLRTLPRLLDAPQIAVRHGRAEQAADLRGRFAVALTRAAANPRAALELTIPLLDVGGVLIAYARPPDDPAPLEAAAETLGAVIMPVSGPVKAEVELIAAVKTRATPDRYPRAWPQIRRRPL